MRFDGFYGNAQAKELLSGLFDSGRVPHALLIDGPEGSGKRTLARIAAQAAVCASSGEKPCGACRQCRNVLSGNHPDITFYTAGTAARSFSVDTVRAIRMDMLVAPNDALRKVTVIAGAHHMTEQAQNALLKILEEPPEYAMFILTCEGRSRILPTVQSRSMLVTLGPVSGEEAVAALVEAGTARPAAEKAAAMSGNLIGRAKAALEDQGLSQAAALGVEFADRLCGDDPYAFLRISGKMEKDAELFRAFLRFLPLLFRDAAAVKSGVSSLLSGCGEEAKKLSGAMTLRMLHGVMEEILGAADAADRYANQTLLLTDLFSKCWTRAHDTARI